MIIEIYGEQIKCHNVIKSDNKITILDENGRIIREDSGITDFSGYVMIEGAWTENNNATADDVLNALLGVTV